jgi:hypothetical protein
MRKVCTIAVAVLSLSLGSMFAAGNSNFGSTPRPAGAPTGSNVPFIATSVTTQFTDPEGILPCFNCVTGPDIQTLLMGLPLAAVTTGAPVTIVITADDLYYTGNIAVSYTIMANPATAPVSTGTYFIECAFPSIWWIKFPISAPAPGLYMVEATITTANPTFTTKVTAPLLVGAAN